MGKTTLPKSARTVSLRDRTAFKWLTSTVPLLFVLLIALAALTPTRTHAGGPSAPTAAVTGSVWNSLNPTQQQALKPLANDWATLTPERQQKWLVFADKFQKMKPEDQQRAQEKMAAWVRLTPEQRLAARENYIRSNKLQPDQRAQKWEEYQQLSDEQKAQLASHEKKKLITNLPTPAESKEKKLQPLKTPKKPVPAAQPGTASLPAVTAPAPSSIPNL